MNRTVGGLDHPRNDGESESGSFFAASGGEKWFEDLVEKTERDASGLVLYGNADKRRCIFKRFSVQQNPTRALLQMFDVDRLAVSLCAHVDRLGFAGTLESIDHEVE